jgi:tetratricopeptide (TPR) repeat protein
LLVIFDPALHNDFVDLPSPGHQEFDPMLPLPATALAVFLGVAVLSAVPGQPLGKGPATRLPLSGLEQARIAPNLCLVHYRVSTSSGNCQAQFDQGLGYLYSYVWMEASRSFETAAHHDPDCAMAWWGLSRALERWGKSKHDPALEKAGLEALRKAGELRTRASHREQLLILARLKEKGLVGGARGPEARKQAAVETIDEALALYDDDEEAWFYRAQLGGGEDLFGGRLSSVPFYKALIGVNPLHPGANHELLHFYESYHRPALGWIYAENYIKSSPGIPHAFHMQAHLATRLGRWDKTSDRSAHAIDLERAYHKAQHVRPQDDQQFAHHLEVLTLSLIHDGRYRQAHAIKDEMKTYGMEARLPWFRLALAERDAKEALRIADQFRKEDKATAAYLAATVYVRQGNPARAAPEVEVLRQAFQEKKTDRLLEDHLSEIQGLLLCATGAVDAGLNVLARIAGKSKTDYGHHAWGNGATLMEIWGCAALRGQRTQMAEEAFLEALAHDPGSVRAALGLQVLCERQGRAEEAERYRDLARRSWRRADEGCLAAELASLRNGEWTASAPFQRARNSVPGAVIVLKR